MILVMLDCRLILCIFAVFVIFVSQAQDCPQTSYHFPRDNQTTDFIKVKQRIPDLSQYSVCGWYTYAETAGWPHWYTYNKKSRDSDFRVAIHSNPNGNFYLTVTWRGSGAGRESPPSGSNFHFCVVTNGISEYRRYRNGELASTVPRLTGLIKGNGTLVIGHDRSYTNGLVNNPANAYKGNITNFMIWDRVLTSGEIKSMYESKCYCAPGYFLALTKDNVDLHGAVSPIQQTHCPPATIGCPQTSYRLPYDAQVKDYIRAKQPFPKLDGFSFCGRFTYYPAENFIVSYATSRSDDAYTVYHTTTQICIYIINSPRTCANFQAPASGSDFHLCITTFASANGTSNVYVNGDMHGAVHGTAAQIDGDGILILGQDQDNLGGGFQAGDAYKGTISNFMTWNRILDAKEIKDMYLNKCHCASGFSALDLDNVELFGAASAVVPAQCDYGANVAVFVIF